MAHKKALLTKFKSDPEDTEGYQSPTFDGRTWTVPETASSDQESGQISDQQLPPNRENTQNQDLQPKPSTSGQQITSQSLQQVSHLFFTLTIHLSVLMNHQNKSVDPGQFLSTHLLIKQHLQVHQAKQFLF